MWVLYHLPIGRLKLLRQLELLDAIMIIDLRIYAKMHQCNEAARTIGIVVRKLQIRRTWDERMHM